MRNSSTSNAASWRTTVSNIAFISWESIRWPSASTTSLTGASGRVTASSPDRSPERLALDLSLRESMRHSVEHDVDADRVAVRRELVEVFLALAFALPGVGDVGVVRHDDHQAALVVG